MTAKLVVKAGLTDKKEYALEPGRAYFIGRSREAEVIVKDQQASRRHCAIEGSADGKWTVADHDSSNGTHLNGQRIKTRPLKDGDEVRIGKTLFKFCLADAPAKAKPSAEDTILVGTDGKPKADEPKADEPEADEPKADEPKERPAPRPKKDTSEEDLKDLFSFLDKIEAGERPAADDDKKAGGRRSVPHEPPPVTPPPATPLKEKDDGKLFALVDGAQPAKEAKPPPPADEPEKKGGLLGFLRRKKKQS